MTKKPRRSVESQLHCKSTAALDSQIAKDLSKKDKPLSELLEEEEETEDAQE